MKSKSTAVLSDTSLRVRGIDALNKALGPAAALRFLALWHRDTTDYVEISRVLYENQSVDEIYDRAAKRWKD